MFVRKKIITFTVKEKVVDKLVKKQKKVQSNKDESSN